ITSHPAGSPVVVTQFSCQPADSSRRPGIDHDAGEVVDLGLVPQLWDLTKTLCCLVSDDEVRRLRT
ncbi:hypothetical protein, partial [Mycobacterium sp. ENV421]|uniref:hypothetical protein n=1 Tax=Mycobacterium sp. ENV421 TaxID=1213407 RepID=UPI001E314C77